MAGRRRSLARARVFSIDTRAAVAAACSGTLLMAAVTPASASAKVLRASATDDRGDAPSAAVDLRALTAQFDPAKGRVRVMVTMDGKLDFSTANTLVVTFSGKGCERDQFAATADFTDPTVPWIYRLRKDSRSYDGKGKANDAIYSAQFRSPDLRGLKPSFVQAAVFGPGDDGAELDQTDCVPLG